MFDGCDTRKMRSGVWAASIGVVLFGAGAGQAIAGGPPAGFTRLADVAPEIKQEMRYAGADNFTGKPVPGYHAPDCWLKSEAAQALAAAQTDARAHGFSLVVYDCYRPQQAVDAFVRWSRDSDQSTKHNYYPHVDKQRLFVRGYIARRSSHSTGLAVDIGVTGWDFGSPFDYFDRRSWTRSRVRQEARAHRNALVALMRRHGFVNYPREWWHFTFGDAEKAPIYDAVID
jgi:D-alanyl-D-alanine dipeptidase